MRINQFFNLGRTQYELDFVDVDTSRDTPLFVDPYFISIRTDPWSVDASRSIHSFFQRIVSLLNQGNVSKAEEIFTNLNEPNETSLGMSKGRPKGRGAGTEDIKNIFDRLANSKAVKTGILEDLQDVRLFIPGIDKDKISDIATNLIRRHLIKYTQDQCNIWGIPLQEGVTSGPMWIRENSRWENTHTKMLVIDERKILLVPKGIVSYATEYTGQEYHRHYVLNFLKSEHLRLDTLLVQRRYTKKGITRRVTKKDLIERVAPYDKEFLADFTEKHPEVFQNYKLNARKDAESLSNADLQTTSVDINNIIDHLISFLPQINTGNAAATDYQRTVVAIMELIFYPRLTSPQLEWQINSGRKRIDITFDNSSLHGFFHFLSSKHDIPCPYIIIECKNYSVDLSNTELDQLIGRFSPNRGKMGLSLCRSFDKFDLFIQRCIDTYKDSKNLIIPLTDDDLVAMLTELKDGAEMPGDTLLTDRMRRIILA